METRTNSIVWKKSINASTYSMVWRKKLCLLRKNIPSSSWTNTLIEIKKRIEKTIPINFNSVLLNRYRNGNDSVAWHADNEKELGINPVIASVSFGATRNFKLRHLQTKETIELLLSNGSLLIMQGALQHHWQHQIPKTKKIVGERINLTFRVIQ